MRELERLEGKNEGMSESFISPTFCQRDGIGRRVRLRSGCLYGVEGSNPSAGISYDLVLKRHTLIRLHASFVLLWCWVRALVFFVIQESSDRGC